MTKKDLKKVEQIVQKLLNEMLFEEEAIYNDDYISASLPVKTLDKIEAFLGHPVEFMGIS